LEEAMDRLASYFSAHWRGDLSLAKSVFVNGLLFYVVLVVALVSVGQALNSDAFFYIGMTIFAVWFVWALVGICRAAFRRPNTIWGRVTSVAAITFVLLVVVLSMRDIALLLG
jgi:hypothetical protein